MSTRQRGTRGSREREPVRLRSSGRAATLSRASQGDAEKQGPGSWRFFIVRRNFSQERKRTDDGIRQFTLAVRGTGENLERRLKNLDKKGEKGEERGMNGRIRVDLAIGHTTEGETTTTITAMFCWRGQHFLRREEENVRRRDECPSVSRPRSARRRSRRRGFPHHTHAKRSLSISLSLFFGTKWVDPDKRERHSRKTPTAATKWNETKWNEKNVGVDMSESERGSRDPTQRGGLDGLDRAERWDERVCSRRGPPPLGARAQGRTWRAGVK